MRRSTTTLVLATVLLAGACSSSTDGSATSAPAAGSGAAASSGAAATSASGSSDLAASSLKALALTAADFPAPYTYTELPAGALDGKALQGALAGAVFDPAECGTAAQLGSSTDLSTAGIALATDKTTMASVAATVAPVTTELSTLDSTAATCRTFTLSLPSAGNLKASAELELLTPPSVSGAETRALRSTTTVDAGTQKVTIVTTTLVAELRGAQIAVVGTPGTDGSAVDESVLEGLLTKAVEKVRTA